MQVIEFIKQNGLDALKEAFNLKIKHYPEQKWVMLNYDQLNSPSTHPVVMECRSLILDISNGVENAFVVSRAFDRFFNYGETPVVNKAFEFNNAFAWEKSDGSLIPCYFNHVNNRWELATKNTAFGEGFTDSSKVHTYRSLILHSMFDGKEENFQAFMTAIGLGSQYTICFEFIGPANQHHTIYSNNELIVLMARHNVSGEYLKYSDLHSRVEGVSKLLHVNARKPIMYPFKSEADMLNQLKTLKGGLKEGLVAEDCNGLRIKVKTKAYLAAMHLKSTGTINPERAGVLVMTGEVFEWLSYNPQDTEYFQKLIDGYKSMRAAIEAAWTAVKDIVDPKEFAANAKNYSFSSILFIANKNKQHPFDVLEGMPENSQAKMLLTYMKDFK